MKKIVLAAVVALVSPLAFATNVGVSVEVSKPGVYGRVDIGRFPQPAVVMPQPVIIAPPRVVVAPAQPVYMWVPPGHRKKWSKHCGQYNACGQPVYFVRDDWYDSHVRHVDDHPGHGKGKGRGKGKHKD